MQARLIAYPPDQAAVTRLMQPGEALRIGRAHDSGLRIEHPSISRTHAELLAQGHGWALRDLGSKNGSFVEGRRVAAAQLDQACWLRLGDVYCQFAPISAAEAAAGESARRERRNAATAHTARLDGLDRLEDLLDASLRGVLELAQCDRGFVLLGQGNADNTAPAGGPRFIVRASLGLDPARLPTPEFSGSVGAVRRALEQRCSVVANDIGSQAWLAARASVVAGGLHALVCLPLLEGERALGAIYADRVRAGPAITALDLELLEAFAERAALWIAARQVSALLAGDGNDARYPQWNDIVPAPAGDRS